MPQAPLQLDRLPLFLPAFPTRFQRPTRRRLSPPLLHLLRFVPRSRHPQHELFCFPGGLFEFLIHIFFVFCHRFFSTFESIPACNSIIPQNFDCCSCIVFKDLLHHLFCKLFQQYKLRCKIAVAFQYVMFVKDDILKSN